MPAPTIRRATPDDAEALSRIGAETFTETFGHLYPPEDLAAFLDAAYGLDKTRRDLADPAKAAWLVELDEEVVGHALAGPCDLPHDEVTRDCGELKRLYVLKRLQGDGTGSRLLAETLAWLERDGRAACGSASGRRTSAPSGSMGGWVSRRSGSTNSPSAGSATGSSSCGGDEGAWFVRPSTRRFAAAQDDVHLLHLMVSSAEGACRTTQPASAKLDKPPSAPHPLSNDRSTESPPCSCASSPSSARPGCP